MTFIDKLKTTDEIMGLLNEGAEDRNKSVAIKYIEKIIELRGLEDGLGNKVEVIFPGLEQYTKENWEQMALSKEYKETKEDINKVLFNKEV